MSPTDFRKISHVEPKILNSLVNWSHTHRHTHTQMDKCKSRADPTRCGSAKNLNEISYACENLQSSIILDDVVRADETW